MKTIRYTLKNKHYGRRFRISAGVVLLTSLIKRKKGYNRSCKSSGMALSYFCLQIRAMSLRTIFSEYFSLYIELRISISFLVGKSEI
jgi:hypothetical protein